MQTVRTYVGVLSVILGITAATLLSGATSVPLRSGPAPGATAPTITQGQTLTQLADGRWLSIGGEGAYGPLATATLWDPRTNVVRLLAPPLNAARAWHSATVLPDGNVLVFGGIGAKGEVLAAAELFQVATHTFVPVPNARLLPRVHHSATLLTDGQLLVAGGVSVHGKTLNTAELWDFQSPHSPIRIPQSLVTARHSHTAALLASGNVLLWGGLDASEQPLQNGELYDPVHQSFTAFPASQLPAHSLSRLSPGPQTPNASSLLLAPQLSLEPAVSSPALVASFPVDGASNVPLDSLLALRFSQPLAVESINTTTVKLSDAQGRRLASVVAAEGGMLAFLLPHNPLQPGTTYTLAVNGLANDRRIAVLPTSLHFTTAPAVPPSSQSAQMADKAEVQPTTPVPPVDPPVAAIPRAQESPGPGQTRAPLRAASGMPALSGQILTLDGTPLAHVTLRIGKQKTRSDRNGQFLLKRIPAGLQVLEIEGASANRAAQVYGRFEVGVEVAPKQTTVLPYTIWMPELDTSHPVTIPSPTTSEVVVTTPRIPGLELHLPPGTVIHDHTGQVVTEVTITPIPVEQPPFPMPGHGRVPIYFTIQPGGAHLSNATGAHAWLVYPNLDQLPPGTEVEFIYYDPEEALWETVGAGLVSADGQRIVPNPGVGVEAFTGSTIRSRPIPPTFGPTPCGCCNGGDGGGGSGGGGGGGGIDGDPCDLGTGLFLLEKTDLVIPDVIPIVLKRTYRSQDGGARPFGIGMSHEYELYISTKNKLEAAELILPDGGQVHYTWLSNSPVVTDWLLEHTATPTRFYKSRLSVNPEGTAWVLTFRDGTVYELARQGPPSVLGGSVLRAIRDRHGNTLTIQRNYTADGYGDISRIISPNGHWVAFTYDAGHHITQATDNLGRTVTYTYDVPTAFGRLIRVTDTNGGVSEYTYNPNHRMLTIKDPRGTVVVTNEYEFSTGRLTQQTLADGGVYQFAYTNDANGKIIQTDVTDPRGKVRRVTLNSAGYRVSDTRAVGQPEQQATTFTWQAGTNLLLARTDPLGRQTTYTYDAKGNTTSVTRLAGTAQAVTTTATYEPTFNQVASVTDPLNHTTMFAYDSIGNLTTLTDPTNRQLTFTSNAQGQPVTMSTVAGTTQLAYALGDLTTVTDPVGNIGTQATDGGGRVLRQTNPLGQQVQYAYDALNRLTQMTDPLGQATAFTYDGNDNLLTLTDAQNGVTQYTYDGKNRVATRKDPLLRQESFQYDGKDNLTQNTDRKGQVTTTTYDSRNRPTVVTYTDGATVQYMYDAGDRVTQIVDSVTGTITRSYDGLDRVTSETTPAGTVTYTYDAASRRTSMTVQGQPPVNYTYDHANRLTQIAQGSSVVNVAYDAAGRRSSLTLPNGIVVTYSYDAASRLTSLTYTQGASTLGNLTYSYDPAGRRIGTGGSFARTGVPDVINTATYNAANQQLTLGPKSATYDNNGNLQTLTDSSGTTTYTWNARDQLASLSGPSVTASFTYDAIGRRKSKTVNGVTTHFLYDGLNVVQELNGGTPTANLLTSLGIDETLLRTDAVGPRLFLSDGLGSTLALTDMAGLVQGEYTYEPFGKTTATGAASTNAFKYTGREDDGTGLYYYRARYYHPALQRFISEDPIGFNGGDANLFAYVFNDPVNLVDPLGLVVCYPGMNCGAGRGWGSGGGGIGGGGRGPGGGSSGRMPGGSPPPNLSPPGAGRGGAFGQAKRDLGIPQGQQPSAVREFPDRTNPGCKVREYDFKIPGQEKPVTIQDHFNGHPFPDNPTQNRGPHFNTPDGGHYDY